MSLACKLCHLISEKNYNQDEAVLKEIEDEKNVAIFHVEIHCKQVQLISGFSPSTAEMFFLCFPTKNQNQGAAICDEVIREK